MIALDTNALVRLLIEDDVHQAAIVQGFVTQAAAQSESILLIPEVLIETVWVLESVYHCQRQEIVGFLNLLVSTAAFTFPEPLMIRHTIAQYQKGGDFADLLNVAQAKRQRARKLISFDNSLQRRFPGYVVGQ
jgi:predicted nucleic-acid-binding protein